MTKQHLAQECWYYDVTSISSYSKKISILEFGYNRDMDKLPQINIGICYGSTTKLPLFYQVYNGSITDKTYFSFLFDLSSADLIFDSNGDVIGVKVRDDAKQFELWEKSIASLLGLGNAINEYLEYGVEKASLEIERKANKIRAAIMRNQNIYLFGKEKSRSGIASF
ncbi:MAG: hypothetical protein ACOX3T_05230 [Bdellovibrionota bacterium]